MPNLALLLKQEIARLARKEIRKELEALRKASAQHRTELAALKQKTRELERRVARLDRSLGKEQAAREEARPVRFRVQGVVALRRRLGLSAAELGALLGVSAQSVYNWESERARPRPEQLAALAGLRKLGKREARARLEEREE